MEISYSSMISDKITESNRAVQPVDLLEREVYKISKPLTVPLRVGPDYIKEADVSYP
jgi:hypothetical protein